MRLDGFDAEVQLRADLGCRFALLDALRPVMLIQRPGQLTDLLGQPREVVDRRPVLPVPVALCPIVDLLLNGSE